MSTCALELQIENNVRRALKERIWEAISDLQRAGVSHTDIIDDLLFEAGWMIEVVASGEANANKEEVRRLISEFSATCAGLIAQPKGFRLDRH